MKKILCLSPHTDDAEFGCGGTVAQHVLNGDKVKWVTFIKNGYVVPDGWGPYTLVKEFKKAMKCLGVKDYELLDFTLDRLGEDIHRLTDTVYKLVKRHTPDVIYTTYSQCRHQDHNALHVATDRAAWRSEALILGYKLPNDLNLFNPNVFVPLSDEIVTIKQKAVASYESQFVLRPWLTYNLIEAQLTDYSAFVDADWVEPFELLRMVVKQ